MPSSYAQVQFFLKSNFRLLVKHMLKHAFMPYVYHKVVYGDLSRFYSFVSS